MKSGKFWIAVLVAGLVVNVFDFVVHGMMLANTYMSMPDVFNQTEDPTWFVVGDFIAVLVFAWFYDKVYASFGGGMMGGATYGLYAGVLVSFPTWIFAHLMIAGFPYGLAWTFTLLGIVWGVIAGAVLGAMYKK
ncbi:MAG: hypothetical protein ACKVRP_13775 [Bacteroidota bacterium]